MECQTYILTSKAVVSNAAMMLRNLPADGTMEAVFRKRVKKRTNIQNSRYWSKGILATIVEQGWLDERQFGTKTWHYFLREKFLPEVFDEKLCLPGYEKWVELPNSKLVMVGSTTMLTTLGMCNYCDQSESWASTTLGIQFPVNPRTGI